MLNIQLQILKRKKDLEKYKATPISNINLQEKLDKFKSQIKFKLTTDQERTIQEILSDMNKEIPMYRLLQGDVGSGKTIVAAFAAFTAIENGLNTVIMSPTTILANQTYNSLKLLINEGNLKLITSSTKNSKEIVGKDAGNPKSSNTGHILIGTHALLYQDHTKYSNLGLVIIDEQHRFGVEQRQKLLNITNAIRPHYLVMTATPIPRTMLIALFGDMETSIIRSKPAERKDVLTYLVPTNKKNDAYTWLNEKIKKGEQVFWVCPSIEENEETTRKSIQEVFKELKTNLSAKIEILHGKMKDAEKNNILEKFRNKEIDVLLATTVIEVGIDIPNANIIVIESAENFGLAQLHQLRGRVGRGNKQGYCFLFTTNESSKDITERLNYFSKESNGLKISEYDLQRRGPGEVYGTKQSGIPDLRYANIFDEELIKKTKQAAEFYLNYRKKSN